MSYVSPSCNLFVRDFSPGYLDTPEPDVLSPGATPDARNAVFAKISETPLRVTMQKRLGHRLITPQTLTGLAIDGLFDYRRIDGSVTMLAITNGWFWYYKGSAFVQWSPGYQPFTPGKHVRGVNIKNQAVLMDGTAMIRVAPAPGGDVVPLAFGFWPPTGAPGLAVGAAPGVTGVYEGFAVWYDSVTDHESSPSPVSIWVTFSNQSRVWTKPAGTPPSNVTHWRIYARRVDIYEVNFYRSGTFPVASTTGTEAVPDLARVNIGPAPHANDPPPGAFELMTVFRGYAIGVLTDGTELHFSAQSDVESWNPSDILKVNFGREAIRSIKVVGENCVVQTSTMSFRLEGDRMPFRIVNLHTMFGSVSQDAGVEVEGWLYGWDDQRGPYRVSRDFGTWESLSSNRIDKIVRRINRDRLKDVLSVHDPVRHLVLWTFPVGVSDRRRTVLAFDYTLGTWAAPITGLEYGAWTTHVLPGTSDVGLYVGDLWGRVFEMFSGTRDGVPNGPSTVVATVTGGGTYYVDAGAAQFYTDGSGLMGLPVAVVSPTGQWQWRRIRANSATSLSLDHINDPGWTTVPQPGWTVIIGGIEWYWTSPWLDFGRPDRFKRGSYLTVLAGTAGASIPIEVLGKFNSDAGITGQLRYSFSTTGGAGIWGTSLWGEALWASLPQQARKQRLGRTFLNMQLRLQNFYPDQTVDVTGYAVEGDWLPRRRAR